MTSEALVRNDNVSIKVGVGGGGEIEVNKVNKIESQKLTYC